MRDIAVFTGSAHTELADEVCAHLARLSPDTARSIGERARARVLREHTYEQRAEQLEALLYAVHERDVARARPAAKVSAARAE